MMWKVGWREIARASCGAGREEVECWIWERAVAAPRVEFISAYVRAIKSSIILITLPPFNHRFTPT